MSGSGNGFPRRERRPISDAVAARRRAQMVSGLRGLKTKPPGGLKITNGTGGNGAAVSNGAAPATNGAEDQNAERCDLCSTTIPHDHRHMIYIDERRIVCTCESCWALRSGDAEYRPVGNRILWLDDLDMPDEVWAGFQIPIGLAFFMYSTTSECVVAMYPSPAGATESELHFDTWNKLVQLNPELKLEPDTEGLIANRLADPPVYAIAPIDRCYELTGAIKASWDGISGGTGVEEAVARFFADLEAKAL
ncbi:MAG TPA: DUF5947 family protein [Solirubrobacteraceae bacterium]|jgi:hypothetical protein|nr:DUF5947 family protein [Solirubrobacteraceae bacterium]